MEATSVSKSAWTSVTATPFNSSCNFIANAPVSLIFCRLIGKANGNRSSDRSLSSRWDVLGNGPDLRPRLRVPGGQNIQAQCARQVCRLLLAFSIRGLSFHTQLNLHNDHNQLINILDIREILEYGFAPMVLGKISQEQTALLQKSVANMEKNAREQKFSPKDEYHIHLKLYEPLNNPLLIQYLDAFWQIYQQVEKGLPPPTLSPEKLAMQHRELIDAVEAHDLVRMQRAILQYFQSIRQRLQQGGHDAN